MIISGKATQDIKEISPLALAFIGDGVYEMLVREMILSKGNAPVDALHKKAVLFVRARQQAKVANAILPKLSEEEQGILKRGRNAKTGHTPKGASEGEYHLATGLEALFGYLYLTGNQDRIDELFKMCLDVELIS